MSQLIQYSGQFNNPVWLVSGSAVGAAVATATANATPGGDVFYTFGQAVSGEHRYQTASVSPGNYQVSFRVRKTGSTAFTRLSALQIGGAALQYELRVNLFTGAVQSSTNITNLVNEYGVIDESASYWRLWYNVTLNTGTTGLRIRPHRVETNNAADIGDAQISSVTLGTGVVAYERHPASAMLTVGGLDVGVSVDSVGLVQQNALAVNDAEIDCAMDSLVLVQASTLAVGDVGISAMADNIGLSSSPFLVMSELLIACDLDSFALVQAHLLSVLDVAVLVSLDNIGLLLDDVLTVQSGDIAIISDLVVLQQGNLLAVESGALFTSLDPVFLGQQNALLMQDVMVELTMDFLTLGGGVFLADGAVGVVIKDFKHVVIVGV